MLMQMVLFHSFLWPNNIPLAIKMICIHSSVNGHSGCFRVLAIVKSAVMNTEGHVSFWTSFFSRYMPSSGIAESYGPSIFGLLGNLHILFQSGCTSVHSHQQYKRVGRTLSWLSSIPVAPSTLAFFLSCGWMIQAPHPGIEPSLLSVPSLRLLWGHRSFSSGPALIQCDLIITWLYNLTPEGNGEKDPFPSKFTFPGPKIRIWTYRLGETQFNPLCPLFSGFHCLAKLTATLWKTFLFHFLF